LAEGLRLARREGVLDQYLLEVDRDEAMLATDLTWLDGMLARLADPDFAWGPPPEPSERYLAQRKAARQ
jgi:hypothetical protein